MKTNTFRLACCASLILMFAAPAAWAKGNASDGKAKSTVCHACHGVDGKSVDPTYPNLAGQYPSYLAKALRDYRSGARTNPIMAGFSANLSDQDIEDLAAWYGSQEGLKDLSIK